MSYLINSPSPLGISPFDQEDDFYDSLFSRDFALLTTEPSEFVINPDDEMLRSIHKDCKLIESSGSASPSDMSETSESSLEAFKYEIRNHDCMWSGRCNDNDNNNIINDILFNELEPNLWTTTNTTNTMNVQQQQQNNNKNNIINNKQQNSKLLTSMISPKLVTPQMTFFGTTMTNQQQQQQQQIQLQNIPPGTSLLLNSRLNQQKQKINNNNKLIISENFNNSSSSSINNKDNNIRPDTPLSLDDDPPTFKHSVDLAACIMGSNNICLENVSDADKIIIRKLKEQLEDTTTEKIDIHKILPGTAGSNKSRSLTEVLNAIGSVENGGINNNDDIMMAGGDSGESDTEDDEDFDDDLIDDDDLLIKNSSTPFTCNIPPPRQNIYSNTHSDHSYTRLKNGGVNVIGLGLETPSDSDEEIDVVSIGDKKLPTNPSDKDRRAIQTRVAKKISARIVKTPNGIKTIPPRRRCSYEPSTLIAKNKSKMNSTSTSSYYGSISSSAASTPPPSSLNYRKSLSSSSSISSSSSSSSSTSSKSSSSSSSTNKYTTNNNSRKRSYASSKDDYVPTTSTSSSAAKRHRGKKQKTTTLKKHMGMNEADTIQKRNLHNNMERQRRIGLKNLFEALKRQIPNLRDKERAPKVIILREAAQICKQQITDEAILSEMKQTLKLQMQKNQALLAKLNMETLQHNKQRSRSIE